ncbi:MAG: hypothetical protein LAN59_00040 [Acidobacteriia bacterium]|nr:hypothetical protein [Terriglobia bacterium]
MIRRIPFIAVFAFLLAPAAARACTCAHEPPGKCPGLKEDNTVFLGTVTAIEHLESPAAPAPATADAAMATARLTHYQFRVEERFAGLDAGEIDVYSGGEDGDCGYRFEAGGQYVVFTHVGNDGRLQATICSGTRPAGEARALLPQLRAMRNGERVASVFGVLRRTNPPFLAPPDHPDDPLANVSLKLQSRDDRFETSTDANGVYSIYDMHAGEYVFTAGFRSRMELAQRVFPGGPPVFKLPNGACYEYDVDAVPTGHLSGSVLGPKGKPVALASLELYRAGSYGDARPGLWGFQGATGVFDFDRVGPGDYILVFNRTNRLDPDSPFPRAFYPGVDDASHAKLIHLKDGQERLHLNLRLKKGYPTRPLRVRLQWSGGKVPGKVTVMVKAGQGENPRPERLSDELYRLTLLESATYTISAWQELEVQAPASQTDDSPCAFPARITTGSITISGSDTAAKEVLLVFPEPDCTSH